MKLNGKILVAVAMVLGAVATTGCKKSNDQTAPADESPAATTAPAAASDASASKDERTTIVASASVRAPAPPAVRVENPGRAPSAHHVWQRGYWRYDSPRTVYVWVPGYWEDTSVRAPMAPPAMVYEDPGYAPSDDYYFVPGYWRWSGREYVWTYGHWSLRRDAGYYYRPRWVYVNDRWENRMERYDEARRAAYEREVRAMRERIEGDRRRLIEARDRDLRERAERERIERDRREQAERERIERDRREQAERERIERERREHAAAQPHDNGHHNGQSLGHNGEAHHAAAQPAQDRLPAFQKVPVNRSLPATSKKHG